ncbi:MAG: DUF2806 domain-containing protein [Planctomycetes bacterium]|nr:DUF2806 domain-containing protein [Planctomycetota bacterium]
MIKNTSVKLGDLAKPATVLIKKISDAVGGIFKPYQIIRVAKAEAEAERIRAESQIQVTDLHRRAMYRFLAEEAKRQSNIEDITQKALPNLKEDSSPQKVEDDWITNFFDKCRIVSDDDMQKLWSRVLAGEANSPGAFSRRTVNLLADLDKNDAELFMRLCSFGWVIGNIVPLVYDVQDAVYKRNGINFNTLAHLESLGFIQFNNITDFQRLELPKKFTAFYYGKPAELTFSKDAGNKLELGKVRLTRAGQEIASICESKPVDGFYDFVYNRWACQSLVSKRGIEQ